MDDDDLLKDLDEDLGFMSESNDAGESEGTADALVHDRKHGDIFEDVKGFVDSFKPYNLSEGVPTDSKTISQAYLLRHEIIKLMETQNDAAVLLLSQLQPILQQELLIVHKVITMVYSQRFPELESLIASPEAYSQVVKCLETKGPNHLTELEGILNREQLLVISLSIQTGYRRELSLAPEENVLLFENIAVLDELSKLRTKIRTFVTSRIASVAPNLCSLVGPDISSLIISAVGGLTELSEIPSCNLASLGKPKYMSHEVDMDASGIRQKGYIYQSELIQSRPFQIHKMAQRMLCAKVALAARVDSAKQTSDGSLGLKWRQEILNKLDKIQDPPNVTNTKPLPIPEDKPKKKRAGRRFRKYKEQFQLSNLRQLQNRIEFGKQETTVLDAYGEEIGMGMAKSYKAPSIPSHNNNAKLRKSMKRRLANETEKSTAFISADARADTLHDSVLEGPPEQPQEKLKLSKNEWYLKHLDKSTH